MHIRSWYIQKIQCIKCCTELILFKGTWKLTFSARNANFSKISNILAKIPLISRIQDRKSQVTYSTLFTLHVRFTEVKGPGQRSPTIGAEIGLELGLLSCSPGLFNTKLMISCLLQIYEPLTNENQWVLIGENIQECVICNKKDQVVMGLLLSPSFIMVPHSKRYDCMTCLR